MSVTSTHRTPGVPPVTRDPRAARHLVAGLLPWLGVVLFATHAAGLVIQRPDGRHQQLVEIGITSLIGVSCLGSGIAHLFFGPRNARSIGWQPSPFQWEVGCADAAFGLVALQAAGHGPDFWLAIIAVNGIVRLGCGIGHIRRIVTDGNHAVNNTAILAQNVAVSAFLLLAWLAWHAWA